MSPHQILEKYYGYTSFRDLQLEIIEAVLNGKDALGILPTGGGKSVCFQVPAMILEGVCIVVTPLIALMKDQVTQLKNRGIVASAIYSGMKSTEIDRVLDNCVYGDTKFLYVSPERLQTEIMIERARKMKVSLLVIDEAHCISKWGHDFRPPYLRIAEFKKYLNDVKTIALTATATNQVRKDILENLEMYEAKVFVKSFARKNLAYFTWPAENKEQALVKLLSGNPGSSIVYVNSRKKTQDIAKILIKSGLKADFYHAGLDNDTRTQKQENWISSHDTCIVSTNAFGMGIDKPDVRTVFHLDLPENLEAYYQESGRAGRDQLPCKAIIIYQNKDIEDFELQIEKKYPHPEKIKRMYQCLCNKYKLAIGSQQLESFDFDLFTFCSVFGLNTLETHYALKILVDQGIILLSDAFYSQPKIMLKLSHREIYEYQIRNEKNGEFLKVILRIYGGELYSNYLNINETEIAYATQTTKEEVIKTLDFLSKTGIIDYIKQTNATQITFLNTRYDAERLPVNFKEVERKKNQEITEKKKVVQFATGTKRCKMQVLQEHFDEKDTKRCGICVNCMNYFNTTINQNEIIETRLLIDKLLPISIHQLQNVDGLQSPQFLEKIIEESIEQKYWGMDSLGLLYKI